jgi:hypothetical protein
VDGADEADGADEPEGARRAAVAVAPAARRGTLGGVGQAQRHLAAGVDVVDAHLDLLAELEHVFHPVDALAPTDLGDVEQAVAAGEDVDEGAELGDVDDPALVGRAHLGGRRVEDELHLALGLFDRTLVARPDGDRADHAVVVDAHVRPGLGGDGVDDLALRPDDLTDLVDRDLERRDLRGGLAHLVTRLGDRLPHHGRICVRAS